VYDYLFIINIQDYVKVCEAIHFNIPLFLKELQESESISLYVLVYNHSKVI